MKQALGRSSPGEYFASADGSEQVWSSRHHRKGLLQSTTREAEEVAVKLSSCLWMPQQLNWWIGIIFAVGALLFALASVLSLWPNLAAAWSLDSTAINAIFFAGSIPFTIAAYLQLFQAANAGDFVLRRQALQTSRPNSCLAGDRTMSAG